MKRHIDCSWLIKDNVGNFKCCDIRGAMQGKEISEEEALKEACEFCHFNNEKESEDKISIIINRRNQPC